MANIIITGQTYTDKYGNSHDDWYGIVNVQRQQHREEALVYWYIFAGPSHKDNTPVESGVELVENGVFGNEYDTWFSEQVLQAQGVTETSQGYAYMAQFRHRILDNLGQIQYGDYIFDPVKWVSDEPQS